MHTEYYFLTEDGTPETTTIQYYINIDTPLLESPIVPTGLEIDQVIPLEKFNYGTNTLQIVITSDGIKNSKTYNVIREKVGDITRDREHIEYSGGFSRTDINSTSEKDVCSNAKITVNTPTLYILPSNMTSIGLED